VAVHSDPSHMRACPDKGVIFVLTSCNILILELISLDVIELQVIFFITARPPDKIRDPEDVSYESVVE
jgi:hypothetical protein